MATRSHQLSRVFRSLGQAVGASVNNQERSAGSRRRAGCFCWSRLRCREQNQSCSAATRYSYRCHV